MLHSKKWLVALVCSLVVAGTLLVATPHASALSLTNHTRESAAQAHIPASCNFTNALVIIWYNGGNSEWDDCAPGYTTPGLGNVTEVYDQGGDYVWFKWYNGPTGRYCTLRGYGAFWDGHPGIDNITQVDYGDGAHSNSQC